MATGATGAAAAVGYTHCSEGDIPFFPPVRNYSTAQIYANQNMREIREWSYAYTRMSIRVYA